jgi:hypothetical protein
MLVKPLSRRIESMLVRLWLVISLGWSLYWSALCAFANTCRHEVIVVTIAVPWVLGLVLRWIVCGSLRSGVDGDS